MASENPWTEFTISETSSAASGSSTGGICGACPTGCRLESGSMPAPATDPSYLGLGQQVWGKPVHRHGVRPVLWMQSGSIPAGQRETHTLEQIRRVWPAHVVAYDPQYLYHYQAYLAADQFGAGTWDPVYLSVDPSGSLYNIADTLPGGSVFTSEVIDLGWYWNQYFWYFDWLDRRMYGASGSFEIRDGPGYVPDSYWSDWRNVPLDDLLPPSGSMEVSRFQQWRVTVYAEAALDYRLFQVSYKAMTQADYDALPKNYPERNRMSQPYTSGSAVTESIF